MKKNPSPPNRIAEIRKTTGMSQQEVADAARVHWVTISKLERGHIKLTTQWMEKLAAVLGVQPADLMRSEAVARAPELLPGLADNLPRFLADAESPFLPGLAESDNPFRELRGGVVQTTVNAVSLRLNKPGAYWLRILDHSREPFLHSGDLVQVLPLAPGHRARFAEGRLGFLELGPWRQIGFLFKGSKPGTWSMFWLGTRLLHDVRPKTVAAVVAILSNPA
jgi:transcriptional regulator with XRE-family HTH domain